MEIVFNNVSFKNSLKNVSFTIKDSGIYSFVGSSKSKVELIGKLIYDNDYNGIKISKNNKIGYVNHNPYSMFKYSSVYKELESVLKEHKYSKGSLDKRIKDSLKIVDFSSDYLDKDPNLLDIRNAKKLSLIMALIYNPNVIILNEITSGLTYNDKKELIRLLKMLKNKYNKIVILITKDTSFSYSISDYIYLFYKSMIVDSGKKVVLEKNNLNDYDLEIPNIVSFVSECIKEKHDINYCNNILDLIKEVYRDVY